jgi:hypothetical protein
MKRTAFLLSAFVLAGSVIGFQGPAHAGRASAAVDAFQGGRRIVQNRLPNRNQVRNGITAISQFESCVRGYRQGPSRLPLPTAQNLCAHLKGGTR